MGNCPSNHWNDGNDICADCGVSLQDESECFTFVAEWTIDIDSAEGPVDAAKQAFAHMQRPGTSANVFTIIDGLGNRFKVDLSEHEPEPIDL